VGDRIVTVSLSAMHQHRAPKTCTELTERLAALLPRVMQDHKIPLVLTDEETDYPEALVASYNSVSPEKYFAYSPWSYEVSCYRLFRTRVELSDTPRVAPGDVRRVKLSITAHPDLRESHKFRLRLLLPEGWSAGAYQKTLMLLYPQPIHGLYGEASMEFEITVGEQVDAINRAYMEIVSPELAFPMMIPIHFIG
jgi:hypothetical protein